MQDDVWVKRITAVFDGLQKLVVAAAAIIAAWQSTMANQQSVANAGHIEKLSTKQDAVAEKMPPMMGMNK